MRTQIGITLLLAALMGCGGGAEGSAKKVKTYKVTGTVKLLGQPVSNAMVGFAPKEKQPFAMGRTDLEGKYTLTTYSTGDGAAPGAYGITVIKMDDQPETGPSEALHGDAAFKSSHNASSAKSKASKGALISDIYNSANTTPLSFKVEEKDNVYDIEVK